MPVKNSIIKLLHNDWHFLLLIIFFITHGYAEFTGLVPVANLLLLMGALIVFAVCFYWLMGRMFRNKQHAALFVTWFLVIVLFFGAFQDLIGQFKSLSFIAQLRVFVPVSIAVILVLFFYFRRKTKPPSRRFIFFLNSLLALYIVIDLFTIALSSKNDNADLSVYGLNVSAASVAEKPSVYFIVMDEYAGSVALKEYFSYDNGPFEQFLRNEGFRVNKNTSSNYRLTVFSIASTLNMSYLPELGEPVSDNHYGYRKANALISQSSAVHFFRQMGYCINNYSYFQLPGASPVFKSDYLPGRTDLITHKTLYARVAENVERVLAAQWNIDYFKEKQQNLYSKNNGSMMEAALSGSLHDTGASFTYLHLMMPHDPIVCDSLGNAIEPFWKRERYTNEEYENAYLQYLVYANKRMQEFISALKKNTAGKAIIILMSDHGFRLTRGRPDLSCSVLNAVYLPQKNYGGWYDGMSNANQFRVLFNNSFKQQLPLLKDQCY